MEITVNKELFQAMMDAGKASAAITQLNGSNVPVAVIPDGYKVQPLPELVFNTHEKLPKRVNQAVTLGDLESFIGYFTQFKDDTSVVFADETTFSIKAILDYHDATGGSDKPRLCQHTAQLQMRHNPQWNVWVGTNGKRMEQGAFSEFLEQHAMDINTPAPAEILDVAQDLEGSVEAEFAFGERQADGRKKLKYTETIRTNNSKGGELLVPEFFVLQIPVFVGSTPALVKAFLRFRVASGKLTFFYTLVRPEMLARDEFILCRDRIAEKLGITILSGSAAAPGK